MAKTRSILCLLGVLVWLFSSPALGQDDAGKKAYEKRCVTCHGPDGKGDTKIGKTTKTPDLTDSKWDRGSTPADIEKVVRQGAGKMPKYEGKLTDEEIAAVSKYVLSLGAKK